MKQIIESISYPCPVLAGNPATPVFGVDMKCFVVGFKVSINYNEVTIVSAIAPAKGGGYAVTFEDGRMLFINDHPQMEVLYKPLTEEPSGNIQDTPPTEGV